MTLNWTTYGTTMAEILSVSPEATLTGSELFDRMIEYAELRIYRELDFLTVQTEADTGDMTAGSPDISVPGSILIVNSVSLITPASTAAASGTLTPLQRVSTEFMNAVWPVRATQDTPQYYRLKDNSTIAVAPTPDDTYRLNVMGIVRPAALSASNTTTYLTVNVPDLFVAASAIFGFGAVLSNFGAQADDPQSVQSWENQYQLLKASVDLENLRSKAWAQSWQPWSPTPIAKESRT